MKYAAVTLLFALLNTPAVLAQSPQSESDLSSWQDRARVVDVPVTPQPDAPIRLTVKAYWSADSKRFALKASGVNVSQREILGFFVRRAAAGGKGPGQSGWLGDTPDLRHSPKVLRPGDVYSMERAAGSYPADLFPLQVFEVEAALFTDGTLWCPDVCRVAQRTAGRLAGRRAFVARLLEVLAKGGPDAVVQALREKVSEDDPVPAVLVTTGPLVDIKPPRGHTQDWEDAFREVTKSWADSLWQHYALYGTEVIEPALRDLYRMDEVK